MTRRIVHLKNIMLNLREDGVVRRRFKPIVFLDRIQLRHALKKFATDFSKGSEEWISPRKLQIELQSLGRLTASTEFLALRADIAPPFRSRAHHEEVHFSGLRQFLEKVGVERR